MNTTPNPFPLFTEWFSSAKKTEPDATVMTLATADKNSTPSARIVLLKHYDDRGFCFFTNLTSRKSHELKENPQAALCFYWPNEHRQIRIEGKSERVSEKEADEYFLQRPRGSQIGAWASKQSMVMQNETDLPNRVKQIADEFKGNDIPRPPFWSGFRLIPSIIEFWQEGEYRLHTRLRYSRENSEWMVERLYP